MKRVERSTSVPIALLLAAPRTSRHASRTPHPRTPTCSLGPPVSQSGVATITGTRHESFLSGGGVAFPSDGSRMACSRQDTEKYVQYTEKYMNAISIALPFRQWNYLRCMAKDDAVFRRMERKESNWH